MPSSTTWGSVPPLPPHKWIRGGRAPIPLGTTRTASWLCWKHPALKGKVPAASVPWVEARKQSARSGRGFPRHVSLDPGLWIEARGCEQRLPGSSSWLPSNACLPARPDPADGLGRSSRNVNTAQAGCARLRGARGLQPLCSVPLTQCGKTRLRTQCCSPGMEWRGILVLGAVPGCWGGSFICSPAAWGCERCCAVMVLL